MAKFLSSTRRKFLLTTAGAALLPRRSWAQAAQPAFKIGALNPITGSGSAYGPGMQKIIQATADTINAAGGAGGRRLEVFAEDTQTQPEAAVLAAKKLVEVNGVQAILGTWSSGETLAVMGAVTQPNGLLHLHVSGAEEISKHAKDLAFRYSPLARDFGVVYAKIAMELGLKKPAILQFNNESAAAQSAGFIASWRKAGRTTPEPIIYEAKRPTYRAELQQALRDNPDFVVLAAYVTDAMIILREWYQTGIPTKFLMPSWAVDQKLIQELGPDVTQGIQTVASTYADANPSYKEYDALYRKATGQPGNTNKYGSMCWDMVNTLALAMEVAGPTATPTQIAAKLRDVTNPPGAQVGTFTQGRDMLKQGKINYEGACSNLTFDRNGDDEGSSFSWQAVDQGAFKLVKVVTVS